MAFAQIKKLFIYNKKELTELALKAVENCEEDDAIFAENIEKLRKILGEHNHELCLVVLFRNDNWLDTARQVCKELKFNFSLHDPDSGIESMPRSDVPPAEDTHEESNHDVQSAIGVLDRTVKEIRDTTRNVPGNEELIKIAEDIFQDLVKHFPTVPRVKIFLEEIIEALSPRCQHNLEVESVFPVEEIRDETEGHNHQEVEDGRQRAPTDCMMAFKKKLSDVLSQLPE